MYQEWWWRGAVSAPTKVPNILQLKTHFIVMTQSEWVSRPVCGNFSRIKVECSVDGVAVLKLEVVS